MEAEATLDEKESEESPPGGGVWGVLMRNHTANPFGRKVASAPPVDRKAPWDILG